MAEHPCNLVTKPVLIILVALALLVSAYVAYMTRTD
jgi:hypothetical protein